MSILCSLILALSISLQNSTVRGFPAGTFTEKEAGKIEKESNDIDARINVYRNASIRMQNELRKMVSKAGFRDVPGHLQLWTSLITQSLKDIEASIDPKKKKSKALIKYEIHVRETLNDLRELQIRAPYEQQDVFEDCIDAANAARGKMVDILFQPEKALEQEVEQ